MAGYMAWRRMRRTVARDQAFRHRVAIELRYTLWVLVKPFAILLWFTLIVLRWIFSSGYQASYSLGPKPTGKHTRGFRPMGSRRMHRV